MRSVIETRKAPKAIGPYSQAIKSEGLLFTSGQIPLDPVSGEVVGADIASQTKQVMENLKALLLEGDSSLELVLKSTCFLKNMDDFSEFNRVYLDYFGAKAPPARSCVAVKELPKGVLVEVETIALTME